MLILQILAKGSFRGADRLPVNDVRVMSCSANFGQKTRVSGSRRWSIVLRKVSIGFHQNVQIVEAVKLRSWISNFVKIWKIGRGHCDFFPKSSR